MGGKCLLLQALMLLLQVDLVVHLAAMQVSALISPSPFLFIFRLHPMHSPPQLPLRKVELPGPSSPALLFDINLFPILLLSPHVCCLLFNFEVVIVDFPPHPWNRLLL